MLIDADGRAIMAHAMRRLARPNAAAHVATLVWSLVSSQAPDRAAKSGSVAPLSPVSEDGRGAGLRAFPVTLSWHWDRWRVD